MKAQINSLQQTPDHDKVKDITKTEKWFNDFVVCSSAWVWEVDAHGRYTYCSSRVEKILGYPVYEIIGKTPFDFMTSDEAVRVANIFSSLAEKKAPIVNLENWNISRSGDPVCLMTNGLPFFDKTGSYCGYRGTDKVIAIKKDVTQELQTLKKKLKNKTKKLDDMLTAYTVLLKQNYPKDIEAKIISNMNEIVFPFIEKLKAEKLNKRQQNYLSTIETQLKGITAPFFHNLSTHFSELTPTETKIAGFIEQGRTTKEISQLLDSSIDAVKFHRYNLRKKFDLQNTKISLRNYLQKLSKE